MESSQTKKPSDSYVPEWILWNWSVKKACVHFSVCMVMWSAPAEANNCMILIIDDGTDCHKFFSDPGQTSMCLKLLLCNQGTPPSSHTDQKHQQSKTATKAVNNALKVLQNRILHKNPNQNMTQHKKIYQQEKTNIKKNTSHIRHTNTTEHKVW